MKSAAWGRAIVRHVLFGEPLPFADSTIVFVCLLDEEEIPAPDGGDPVKVLVEISESTGYRRAQLPRSAAGWSDDERNALQVSFSPLMGGQRIYTSHYGLALDATAPAIYTAKFETRKEISQGRNFWLKPGSIRLTEQ